ncbi:MAG: nucleotidyl transferase AbiEii/AbiGii toxin family protein [Candidatus Riflebacteria bacterium]|nr:nucleotidyl transferase AbiEii/AbiGii toxin family protein [Candidatus Riflebacteria bacterium]
MVQGIEKFKAEFSQFSDQYVLIGGTACSIILEERNSEFRATKDLDIVLVIEALREDFVEAFCSFIGKGGYEHIDKNQKQQYYRFSKPRDSSFPAMLELFSRKPEYLKTIETRLAPIHVSDEQISLSAILLDDEYYKLITTGSVVVENLSVLRIEYLLLFKMKAWLDLSERKNKDENVDSKDIRKHKNDVIRLAINIDGETEIALPEKIKEDAARFLIEMKNSPVDLKSLRINNIHYKDIIERIENCFGL